MPISPTQQELLQAVQAESTTSRMKRMSRGRIVEIARQYGIADHHVTGLVRNFQKVGHGVYNMTIPLEDNVIPMPEPNAAPKIDHGDLSENVYVPAKTQTFVPWGHYNDVEKIIASKHFFPVFITGLSGNGKTVMVEQACANAGREYVRVQITPETDEDDLIGGMRLKNGDTVFEKGPVIKAMEAGAILLIDEIDRGSNKLMALQGVMEGKPILIKKTGEIVAPAPGFNILATANTKGQGSDDGRFAAATVIDDAFLERFTVAMEQPYPKADVEQNIIEKHMKFYNVNDPTFAGILLKWAEAIRTTYNDGGANETISTRRICHVIQTFSIFHDRKKSVEMCVSRFDEDTRTAFIDMYNNLDAAATKSERRFRDHNSKYKSAMQMHDQYGNRRGDDTKYQPF